MMLCTVDNERFLHFTLQYLPVQFFTGWSTYLHLYFTKTKLLQDALFIPNHVTNRLPFNIINCEMSHWVFSFGISQLFQSFVASVPTIWHYIQNCHGIFKKTVKLLRYQHLIHSLCAIFNQIAEILHTVHFRQHLNLFGNVVQFLIHFSFLPKKAATLTLFYKYIFLHFHL